MARKKKAKVGYMISAVAERYGIHPQTLRLYEREGLLTPSRSEGNTRLYTEADLQRLELILNMTRELGVNLAGIEVILNMRQKMEELQKEMEQFVHFVNQELERMRDRSMQERFRSALVRVGPRVRARPAVQEAELEKVKAS
jgi:MerR family transcriptional regulator/heat shock protein HspR